MKVVSHQWSGVSKRVFSISLCSMLLALCTSPEAQQRTKIPKIGWLQVSPASNAAPGREIFKQELRNVGYIEGKNITIEYRFADNNLDRVPGLADDLVRLNVDIVVVSSLASALAAKKASGTIPIVFYIGGDPVAAGLVESLARPGGNVTGFTTIAPVLTGKRLELLKETVPKLTRVAVLWNPKDPSASQQWKESELAAGELGLQLHSMEVSSADKFESAFKEATKAHSAAIAVTQNALANANQKLVANLAAQNRLPAIYDRGDFVESGGLMSYGLDQTERFKRIASMIEKILKGTKPTDMPVEQPKKFEFVVNLKAAKQIGLTIPPNVLARADKVIK